MLNVQRNKQTTRQRQLSRHSSLVHSSFSTRHINFQAEKSRIERKKWTATSVCWWRWLEWRGKTSNIFRRTCALSPLQKWLCFMCDSHLHCAFLSFRFLPHDWWTRRRLHSPLVSLSLDARQITVECNFQGIRWKCWEEFFHSHHWRRENRRAMNEKSKMRWRWNYQWAESPAEERSFVSLKSLKC